MRSKLGRIYDYPQSTALLLLLRMMNYLSHDVVHNQLPVRKKCRDELKVIKPQHVHKVDLNVIVYYGMKCRRLVRESDIHLR